MTNQPESYCRQQTIWDSDRINDIELLFLLALETDGFSGIENLSRKTRTNPATCLKILDALIEQGYLTQTEGSVYSINYEALV